LKLRHGLGIGRDECFLDDLLDGLLDLRHGKNGISVEPECNAHKKMSMEAYGREDNRSKRSRVQVSLELAWERLNEKE
jgi:hypothetical protein